MYCAYDIETYPDIFTCVLTHDGESHYVYEISTRRNDLNEFLNHLMWINQQGHKMVGFNNIGFDYPVIHYIIEQSNMGVPVTVDHIYRKAQSIIDTPWNDRFRNVIWDSDMHVPQVDLFKVHHFDNVARSTSLKIIETVLRMSDIQDLPYEPGKPVGEDGFDKLVHYNIHDVKATWLFLQESIKALEFRDELSKEYGRDFTNYNDTKIGKEYFIRELEAAGIQCFFKWEGRKLPMQTVRPTIDLCLAILPSVQFQHPDLNRVLRWMRAQTITETKGVFEDVHAVVNGFRMDFGTGGIHGSIESQTVRANDEWMIIDLDVTSYYPSLAIVNGFYPDHLGPQFCDIYADVKRKRVGYAKGTPQNAALKLALNGVYGDSNNKYSPFYDPMYTMKVTLNGQLQLAMLAESMMMGIPTLRMIQANTDGITVMCRREDEPLVTMLAQMWEHTTGLELERADYQSMHIRDVNNYIAVDVNGKAKCKGAYQYEGNGYHQDQGGMVIRQAAFREIVHGESAEEYIRNHTDPYDFCLRTKIKRTDQLVLNTHVVPKGTLTQDNSGMTFVDYTARAHNEPIHRDHVAHDIPQQRVTRYHVSTDQAYLFKLMPPLAKSPDKPRRNAIQKGYGVNICNRIDDFKWERLDYDYYIAEARKLIDPVKD
jgi:hypothetical protein